jgi:hypothetical protein
MSDHDQTESVITIHRNAQVGKGATLRRGPRCQKRITHFMENPLTFEACPCPSEHQPDGHGCERHSERPFKMWA